MAKSRSPKSRPPKSEANNELFEWVKTFGIALIAAFGIRTFIAQAFHIPSESMLPTLEVGDRLIVFKQSYTFGEPQAGDIIVFEAPAAAVEECRLPPAQTSDFIKRIIGVSGDQVEVVNGQTLVNGTPRSESYIVEPPEYQLPTMTVPPESVLVLGDNRNNSCDGHVWGFVAEDLIVGKAVFRYWPLSRMGAL
jgi:signal peptidase I